MSWIDDYLLYGEEVVYETGLHWSIFSPGIAFIPLGLVNWWFWIPVPLLLGYHAYIFYSHQYVVTNHRLIKKQGIYYIRRQDWPHEKIDDVIYTQTLGDRLWNKGSVILLGMSISKTKIENIWQPAQLRNAIQSQLPAHQNNN
jgi:hypothetical protein